MPTYVYKFVETGETIEVQQGFHDDTLTEVAHPESGEIRPVKKVFTPVGVTFKGSGFFKTDNRGKKSSTTTTDSPSKSDSGTSESKSSDTKSSDTKSSDTKSTSSDSASTASKSDGTSSSKSTKPSKSTTPSS